MIPLVSSSPPVVSYMRANLASPELIRDRPNSQPKHLHPYNTTNIKVLLLENVNQTAVEAFQKEGFDLQSYKSSLSEEALIDIIKDVHMIGIRSKTKLTRRVLDHAKNLLLIGCFCIGTNQVDLTCAAEKGIAVFNSPFSNSRSVAELIIGEIISLSRQFCERSAELHQGIWKKVSQGCWEVRGKTLGIVGYGHIGCQLSVLAESLGMRVIFYDVLALMPLGTAQQMNSLDDLLKEADFVSLHVPESKETKNMISTAEFAKMKKGSYLLNASRGTVVDISALIQARKSGRLAGAALDVYPVEPAANGEYFDFSLSPFISELRQLTNVILTPHIGGSTEEAQSAIGREVSEAAIRYLNEGYSIGAVNFPEVALRAVGTTEDAVRILLVHKNVPGVLRQVTSLFQDFNIKAQFSDSRGDIAYLITDVVALNRESLGSLYSSLESETFTIRVRVLY